MGKSKRSKAAGDGAQNIPRDEEVRISAANLLLGLDPFVPKHKKKSTKQDEKRTHESSTSGESSEESTATIETSEESTASKESSDAETPAADVQSESDLAGKSSEAESHSAPESRNAQPTTEEQSPEPVGNGKSEKSVSFEEEKSQTDDSTQTSPAEDSGTATSEDESVKKSQAAHAQGGRWTESEDAMILGMKDDNASWAVIGNAIGRGKNEVKKRYHEIKVVKANAAAGQDTATSGDKSAEPDKTDDTRKCSHKKDKDDSRKKAARKRGRPASSTTSTSLSAMEAALLASPASSITDDDPAGYDADDYDPYAAGPRADPVARERERRRQDRFMQRHLWASLYPHRPESEAEADPGRDFAGQGFSRRDRRLLAGLEDRRVGNRWLEVQANFFNATGRMLPLHLIKAKLEGQSPTDDEQMLPRVARFRQMVASWNSSVADGDELLDPASAGVAPVDAMR